MGGAYAKFSNGPKPTFQVSEVVKGGQLVTPDGTTGKVKVATAGTDVVFGMAQVDARPDGGPGTTDAFGNPIIDATPVTSYTSLETGGVIYIRNGGGSALAAGAPVSAAANGEVAATGAGGRRIGYVVTGGAAGETVEVQLAIISPLIAPS